MTEHSTPDLPAIGLGCWFPPGTMDTAAQEQTFIDTVHHAIDRGVTLVDTAEAYGPDHQSERLVARALQGRRDEVLLTSRFGVRLGEGGRRFFGPHGVEEGIESDPALIPGFLEASLRRLGVDHLDFYGPHFPDHGFPIEEVVGALGELVSAGKLRWIQLSNIDGEILRRAHAEHPIALVQNEYSLIERTDEADLLPAARELGVRLSPWAPLGRGRAQGLESLIERTGLSNHQLALAWLHRRAPDTVPAVGMQAAEQVDANLEALARTLPDDVLAELDALPWTPRPRSWLALCHEAWPAAAPADR